MNPYLTELQSRERQAALLQEAQELREAQWAVPLRLAPLARLRAWALQLAQSARREPLWRKRAGRAQGPQA